MIVFDRIIIVLPITIGVSVVGAHSYFWVHSHWYTDIRPIFLRTVITDPDDPRFDPMQFRFEYYKSRYANEWDLPRALIKMFPPGTDKSYINKMLVERAGAGVSRSIENEATYAYRWPHNASMAGESFLVWIDAQEKSRSFFSAGVHYYEDRTFSNKFMIKHNKKAAQNPTDGFKYVEGHMRPIRKKYLSAEDGVLQ